MGIFKKLWDLKNHRQLIWTLVERELKARYRSSFLGFFWSFLNPLLLMLVYSTVFQYYMRFQWEEGKPYGVFLFCGLLPWMWFLSSLLEGSASVITGGALVKSVLFPTEILPLVSVLSNLVHFLLGMPILLLFFLYYQIKITWLIFIFPLIVLIQFFFTTGLAFFLAGLSVHFRDIQQILGNLMLLWFFITPIIYKFTLFDSLPQILKMTFYLNPMAHIIMGYQDILYFSVFPHWKRLSITGIVAIFVFFIGYWVFHKLRYTYAEGV